MGHVDKTACVDKNAQIDKDVTIGPYCVVGAGVSLGQGVRLHSHVVVGGDTTLGKDCEVYSFAAIGFRPQDMKYRGEHSSLVIGDGTVIREHVTIHPGTKDGGLVTRIGAHCLLMVGCHIAHDCQIGDHVIIVNGATLGGHVVVGDYAVLGGLCAVRQHIRIGRHAMVSGMSGLRGDVIPYGFVIGYPACLEGLNLVGLRRRKFERRAVHKLREAFRMIYGVRERVALAQHLTMVEEQFSQEPLVMDVVSFMRHSSALCPPSVSMQKKLAHSSHR
ncbi:MAG: acyl-ACP--UDP-N-acetylglucosamine O-acyltransferase [Alphaproteobacteria bacterium GM7ARS4]|nr:acyl-ACP--UDP-N-acetylglucosamine O-acyltransferase [Alphaproteobacteria bacterium GM7ARS4]